jgi:CubicO group peptidase (beta-lactamase class C family)
MNSSGEVAPGYESVRTAFETAQSADAGGAQLAVYHHGVKVVDIWGGRDVARGRSYPGDGIQILTSGTKGVASITVHLLVERGLIDLDAPVAGYWPEFAQNGKSDITLRDIMSHRSGLAQFPAADRLTPPDFLDWQRTIASLERMAPLWRPRSAFMYHTFTFGQLVGEVVRRVTGATIGEVFRREIGDPLGLDLWIGLPEEQEPRVVPQLVVHQRMKLGMALRAWLALDRKDPLVQAVLAVAPFGDESMELLNTREAHAAQFPSGNGIGDARSLAKLYAATIGEVEGRPRLLREETVVAAAAPQTDGLRSPGSFAKLPDRHPLRFATGFEIHRSGNPMLGPSSFGHTGAGGRLAFADPASGIAVGYVCNNMLWDYAAGPDARWPGWLDALGRIASAERVA